MTNQPRFPGSGQDAGAADAGKPRLTARQRRARVATIATVAALLLAMLILHLAGVVGPGTNG